MFLGFGVLVRLSPYVKNSKCVGLCHMFFTCYSFLLNWFDYQAIIEDRYRYLRKSLNRPCKGTGGWVLPPF